MIQWNSGAVGAYAKLPFHRRQNKRQAEFQAPRSAKPCNLSWNHHRLGAPVQLVQGNRYFSRWLAQLAPGVACGDALNSVRQAVFQASSQPTWPWQNLVAFDTPVMPTATVPFDMRTYPYMTPGFCPIWMDGTWIGQTTPTVDSKDLPGFPGFFNTDLFNQTTNQKLVEAPRAPNLPTGLPCNPADLAFDPVTGIFKCAGQIIITPTTSPQTPNPCPDGQARDAAGNCPPASGGGGGSGTKTEEKSSVLPWVIGGGVVLLGGAYLLTR